MAAGFDLHLSSLANQPVGRVAISLSGRRVVATGRSGMAKSAMARASGRISHFHRNALSGPRISERLSIPLLAGRGPFPVSRLSRDDCAGGIRDRLAVEAVADLASSNWLCAARCVTRLASCPHLASE